MSCVALVGWC